MKPYRVRYMAAAIRQLGSIYRWIAADTGVSAADSFEEGLLGYLDGFATAPKRGTVRLRERGIRTVGWKRTVTIAFVVDEQAATVVILAIYYRGRNVDRAIRRLKR